MHTASTAFPKVVICMDITNKSGNLPQYHEDLVVASLNIPHSIEF